MKHRILLGLTGSVATVVYEKLIKELQTVGDVSVILTEKSNHFIDKGKLDKCLGLNETRSSSYSDRSEWLWSHNSGNGLYFLDNVWKKDDPVLHINLRDNYSALVIAPCSANTLAKITNGLCDNLLTTVARAWDHNRPFVIAPAMNTHMWNHPITRRQLMDFRMFSFNNCVINPVSKKLACGTEGMGAMANIEDIVKNVKDYLRWRFPLRIDDCKGIPVQGHPGAFACPRKFEKHTGVDLYTCDKAPVYAVEDGNVVDIEHFTGEWDGSPWWENTDCVLVEGATGVVCYGEVSVAHHIKVGDNVKMGQWIANVKRVLKEGKERTDIMGHSTSMLHMELYRHGVVKSSNGFDEKLLNDPTPFLLDSTGKPDKLFTP